MSLGNAPNGAEVKDYRCWAIAEIIWNSSRLPEMNNHRRFVITGSENVIYDFYQFDKKYKN